MHTFFHGWQRKAGVATLVMACVVGCMWYRGQVIQDHYSFGHGSDKASTSIATSAIGVYWEYATVPEGVDRAFTPGWTTMPYYHPQRDFTLYIDVWRVNWRRRWCGFDFGEFSNLGTTQYWVIPYWAMAWPLTLLSAYLILWKPRKRA